MVAATHIVIIGSGMAGYFQAQSLRQADAAVKITVVAERDGRFYPKPMLSTALFHKKNVAKIITATAQEMAAQYRLDVLTNTKVEAIDVENKVLQLSAEDTAL